jgi:hypothetical protein
VLDGIETRRVDRDDPHVGREAAPRRGGEVLQPGAYGDYDIRLPGKLVR